MKKGEAWLNTFTYSLSYLLRCNSDVTSLLSGTAIKSIVAYITDYITKSPLNTHVIFEAVKTVFDRNTDYLQDDICRQEKARKLVVQIVNNLTVKLEMGAPMACLYLLSHPDHYTNEKFKVFFWRPYIQEVQIVAVSPIIDYKYRPADFEHMNLYDWIRLASKHPIRKSTKAGPTSKKTKLEHTHIKLPPDESNIDIDEIHESERLSDDSDECVESNDNELYNDDISLGEKRKRKNTKIARFIHPHPHIQTHTVTICNEKRAKIPNFTGGAFPRADKGNREEYCLTMLTLFCPWRSGKDLKNEEQSWDDTFQHFSFTERQKEVIKFMQIRYECNDARDDFSAQRKKEKHDKDGIFNIMGQFENDSDGDWDDNDGVNEWAQALTERLESEWDELGPGGIRKLKQMQDIENIMQTAGWTSP
ncbi:hypothetical protein DENSPDRAFT_789682, partial [Dentipellis sp. KUC8613]